MQDLCERADRGGALEGRLEGHHIVGGNGDVIEFNRAAARGALAEAAPVVDDIQARGCSVDEGQLLHALLVDD
ncbi:hypothetical protein D9M73_224050 [compost metagenome]